MNKKILLLCGLFLFIGEWALAQQYISAVGIRATRTQFGVTLQQRVLPQSTVEAQLQFGLGKIVLGGLFEIHKPLLSKGFNYYIGGGYHVGRDLNDGAFSGPDLIAGLELKIPALPLQLSADVKPTFNLNGGRWFGIETGLAVRYILVPDRSNKNKRRNQNKHRNNQRQQRPGDIFKPKQQQPPPKKPTPKKKGKVRIG